MNPSPRIPSPSKPKINPPVLSIRLRDHGTVGACRGGVDFPTVFLNFHDFTFVGLSKLIYCFGISESPLLVLGNLSQTKYVDFFAKAKCQTP